MLLSITVFVRSERDNFPRCVIAICSYDYVRLIHLFIFTRCYDWIHPNMRQLEKASNWEICPWNYISYCKQHVCIIRNASSITASTARVDTKREPAARENRPLTMEIWKLIV